MSSVRSFDVFDTVLTRRVGAPAAVFTVLAERLQRDHRIPVPAQVFASARERLEGELTRRTGRHATLHEIHLAIADALNAGADTAQEWAAAEESLEEELVQPLPGARIHVAAARSHGRVVFVSDTPHSEQFVTSLLLRHGLAEEGERVFTSSAQGATKSYGGLFRAVQDALATEGPFHHVGDDRRSDVAAARVEGWSSAHVADGRLNRYEQLLEAASSATNGLTSWWAGASRLARLEATTNDTAGPVAAVASGVLAPLVTGFALWVAGQARRRGLRRLYYVARDGEVMLAAARPLLRRLAPELELRYLHGSRKPWILGASATSEDFLSSWVTARPDYTPRTLLARVDLTPERVFTLVGLPLCAPGSADQAMTPEQRRELAEVLRQPPLLALVREAAERAAEQTRGYLHQEGLTDGTPSALVDAGWGGQTAYALDHLLREAGAPPVVHLLMGVTGKPTDLPRRDRSHLVPWLFDEQLHPGSVAGLRDAHMLVEMLCAGTVGRTLGYEHDGSAWHPVLAAEGNQPVLDWGLADVQRTAVRTAELVAPSLIDEAMHVDTSDAVFSVLRAFWHHPTKQEAEAWGTFPWEEEIWPPYVPVAQRLTTRDVVGRLLQGEGQIRRVNSWRAGSALVSAQPWRSVLQARSWQLENRERLSRLPRRLRLELAARRIRPPL